MKKVGRIGLGVVSLTLVAVGFAGSVRAEDTAEKIKATGALTALAAPPTDENKLSLLLPGQTKPVEFTMNPDTTIGGMCEHCLLYQPFKAGEAPKKCEMCGCDKTNAICIAWRNLKNSTWQAMFRALPRGIGLRAIYKEADKPESGLKSLIADRRTVLLPVEGLAGQTPEQLLALVKPFDGTKAELLADGKQLVIHLKDDWTRDKATKFEQALAKIGAKFAYPEETASPQPAAK
ncbi:MAG TPA: hypothetical protein VFB38_22240 [Chthonomonadaceae bacterium]|nr:hypothetical protein [Chthonomonadaceae bacterium]